MSEPSPDWAQELSSQAQRDQRAAAREQIAAPVRPWALCVATFYHCLRREGMPRDVAASLTLQFMTLSQQQRGQE